MVGMEVVEASVNLLAALAQDGEGTEATTESTLVSVRNVAQSLQGFITALGILLAGLWALYVFVLGRNFAPNMQLQFDLKQVSSLADGKAAVVTVKVRNIGQTHVRRGACSVGYITATTPQPNRAELKQLEALEISQLDPIDPTFSGIVWKPQLFKASIGFEPGEEAMEEIVVDLGQVPIFKVIGLFVVTPSTVRIMISKLMRRKVSVPAYPYGAIFDIRSKVKQEARDSEEAPQ
jgi:hypothetical protein